MTTDQSRPVSRAFTARLREVLTARLPAGPGWVVWVDGVVEELAGSDGVVLTEAETLLVIRALVDWHGGPDGEFHARRNLASRLEAS